MITIGSGNPISHPSIPYLILPLRLLFRTGIFRLLTTERASRLEHVAVDSSCDASRCKIFAAFDNGSKTQAFFKKNRGKRAFSSECAWLNTRTAGGSAIRLIDGVPHIYASFDLRQTSGIFHG